MLEIDAGLLPAQAQELAGEIARHGASRDDSAGEELTCHRTKSRS